jgi:hypothetical protein
VSNSSCGCVIGSRGTGKPWTGSGFQSGTSGLLLGQHTRAHVSSVHCIAAAVSLLHHLCSKLPASCWACTLLDCSSGCVCTTTHYMGARQLVCRVCLQGHTMGTTEEAHLSKLHPRAQVRLGSGWRRADFFV